MGVLLFKLLNVTQNKLSKENSHLSQFIIIII